MKARSPKSPSPCRPIQSVIRAIIKIHPRDELTDGCAIVDGRNHGVRRKVEEDTTTENSAPARDSPRRRGK